MLNAGVIGGVLTLLSAFTSVFHVPWLGAFLSDPSTASTATDVITGLMGLVSGFMHGWHHKGP